MEELDSEETSKTVNTPNSLCNMCINVCVQKSHETLLILRNTEFLKNIDRSNDSRNIKTSNTLQTPLHLPANVWETLFQKLICIHPDQCIQAFSNKEQCRLTKLDLSNKFTKLNLQKQKSLAKLFDHPLEELKLNCCKLIPSTLNSLKHCSTSLKILDLSYVTGLNNFTQLNDFQNIVRLNLKYTDFAKENIHVIGKLSKLTWLNLSNTTIDDSSLEHLGNLERSLQWLSLYQCTNLRNEQTMQNFLEKMKHLIHFDVSKDSTETTDTDNESDAKYPVVTSNLMKTFSTMKNLISLDISGSAGIKMEDLSYFTTEKKKLRFLGLSNTDGLSHTVPMPAETVTGEATEEQLLTSLEVYSDRPNFIALALRKLFSLAKHHCCNQIEKCIQLILTTMRSFEDSSVINIAAIATLYHLTRGNHPANSNTELRREIVLCMLEAMENLPEVLQVQKNACLTLCNFKIPTELESQYFRITELLLTALKNHTDDYLRRIAIMLFNGIICQHDENQKQEFALKGAIQILMDIIREKVSKLQPDVLMETSWSALWNITDMWCKKQNSPRYKKLSQDETPGNCSRFLDDGGMDLFMKCLTLFPTAVDVRRNMMGLMGNIAEVRSLRVRLVRDDYIQLFMSLLSTDSDSIEVRYNAAGLLCHILSDGPEAWNIYSVSRENCMAEIINCIDLWDINTARNINYGSFKPIICLLNHCHAPAAQHWASWALANLTSVYPFKYCKLVKDEGGLDALKELMKNPCVQKKTKEFAAIAIDSIEHLS